VIRNGTRCGSTSSRWRAGWWRRGMLLSRYSQPGSRSLTPPPRRLDRVSARHLGIELAVVFSARVFINFERYLNVQG